MILKNISDDSWKKFITALRCYLVARIWKRNDSTKTPNEVWCEERHVMPGTLLGRRPRAVGGFQRTPPPDLGEKAWL